MMTFVFVFIFFVNKIVLLNIWYFGPWLMVNNIHLTFWLKYHLFIILNELNHKWLKWWLCAMQFMCIYSQYLLSIYSLGYLLDKWLAWKKIKTYFHIEFKFLKWFFSISMNFHPYMNISSPVHWVREMIKI